jgi:hypothetical protein
MNYISSLHSEDAYCIQNRRTATAAAAAATTTTGFLPRAAGQSLEKGNYIKMQILL